MPRPINRMRPVHPGEVLREDYLVPLGLSVNALAVALVCRRRASMKSSRSGARSPPTPPHAWRGILAATQRPGWSCKPTST
jgi:hypothetical protein